MTTSNGSATGPRRGAHSARGWPIKVSITDPAGDGTKGPKLDVTSANDEKLAIQKAFHSQTLPSVLLYPSNTRWTDLVKPLRAGEAMPRPAIQLQQMTHAPEFKQMLATVE